MKTILFICITVTLLASCEKDYQHDTGLADGYHDCSMMDYLRNDHNNWDSIVVAIKYAGLTGIFEGTNPDYKEITFFGPTNMSIRKFFLEQGGRDLSIHSRNTRGTRQEYAPRLSSRRKKDERIF
ncbi:MAG: hypothetical protein ACLTZT_08035 [Butyricimonas faecalis]